MNSGLSGSNEQHPLLPSGYWSGFYVYRNDPKRHEMQIMLDFKNGVITGDGQDDVGAFTFKGTYDLNSMTCQFIKFYSRHSINYQGQIDENGIWGKWFNVVNKPPQMNEEVFKAIVNEMGSGGFHIWPSKKEFSEHEMALRQPKEDEVVKSTKSLTAKQS